MVCRDYFVVSHQIVEWPQVVTSPKHLKEHSLLCDCIKKLFILSTSPLQLARTCNDVPHTLFKASKKQNNYFDVDVWRYFIYEEYLKAGALPGTVLNQ